MAFALPFASAFKGALFTIIRLCAVLGLLRLALGLSSSPSESCCCFGRTLSFERSRFDEIKFVCYLKLSFGLGLCCRLQVHVFCFCWGYLFASADTRQLLELEICYGLKSIIYPTQDRQKGSSKISYTIFPHYF